MKKLIEIRQARKTYGSGPTRVEALREVNLDVHGGEVLMMLGPSGSGKTTLLSIMGAILRATSGSVRIGGEEITGLSESALPRIRLAHIGFVFQGFNLFPALTASENVELALRLKGASRSNARKQAGVLLERVGLDAKRECYPAEMSGGQKQRIAIARALAGEPRILLADEPTAALDSISGKTVMEMLSSLAKEQGRAVVVVTHDARVLAYGDRIVHMADGAIEAANGVVSGGCLQ